MPQLQMISPVGQTYYCDSSDPELLVKWMMETLPKVTGPSPYDRAQLRVIPGYLWDPRTGRDTPDWPTDMSKTFETYVAGANSSGFLGITGLDNLIEALQEYRKRVTGI